MKRIRDLRSKDIVFGESGNWFVLLPITTEQIGAGNFFYKADATKEAKQLIEEYGDRLYGFDEVE